MKICSMIFAIMIVASMASAIQDVPLSGLGEDFRLIGRLNVPLGEMVTVEGIVINGPRKGYEGDFNLLVQKIRGKVSQNEIQIVITPYFYKWGEDATLPKLKIGTSYEMRGYETGGYVGVPNKVFGEGGVIVQTTDHYFHEEFVVTKAKQIEPIIFAPGMFEAEHALIQGKAVSKNGQALMVGNGWSVIVISNSDWPKRVEGKNIETWGMYNPDSDRKTFKLVDGQWRLIELADQIGENVELHGLACSLNGVWWFRYRGTDIYVENMQNLPGWTNENHGCPMVIRGKLEKAKLPSLNQISLKNDRDLKEYFIVREPSWKPLSALLSPEKASKDPE